jgi:uracil-DNA glycosylase family 4
MNRDTILSALEWYIDAGVTVAVGDMPNNRFSRELNIAPQNESQLTTETSQQTEQISKPNTPKAFDDIVERAQKIAHSCQSLNELRDAIYAFDAHPLKHHATNIIFEDGNRSAKVMVIGDPPSSEEDRNGIAYAPNGQDGALLDKIFASIDLNRNDETSEKSIYITHITHWRPPGNRSLTSDEIAISLPFLQKQIELAQPKIIILMGGVTAKAILGKTESLSRIRGTFYEYGDQKTPVIATYSPAYLQSNPLQKRKVWMDILLLKDKLHDIV